MHDEHGTPIALGTWYWATNRRGKIIGTGQFLQIIGGTKTLFFMNGNGYYTDYFTYVPAPSPVFPE